MSLTQRNPKGGKKQFSMTAVCVKNMYAVATIKKWVSETGWLAKSTFTIICYLKGSRPMAKYTTEQLLEIENHHEDPEHIDPKVVPPEEMVRILNGFF